MTWLQYAYLFLLTVPIIAALDLLWLGVVARGFYQNQLGHLLGQVQWLPAIIFYLVYAAGVMFFAVRPGLESSSVMIALLWGAALGFFAYATYDLTNLATLRGWPFLISIVDILWGGVLTGAVAVASYGIGKLLFG